MQAAYVRACLYDGKLAYMAQSATHGVKTCIWQETTVGTPCRCFKAYCAAKQNHAQRSTPTAGTSHTVQALVVKALLVQGCCSLL